MGQIHVAVVAVVFLGAVISELRGDKHIRTGILRQKERQAQ